MMVLLLYYSREGVGCLGGKGNWGKGGRIVLPTLVRVPIEPGKCQCVGRVFLAILLFPRVGFGNKKK